MAAVYTLHIDAGATFTRQFEYTNDDGSVVDLTGYSALMHVRPSTDGNLTLEHVPAINIATGTISITLTAAETSQLTLPEYVYAIELSAPGGEPVIRLVQGSIKVSPEVVRA
jgi:hypothetical protein